MTMPTAGRDRPSLFDRFADVADRFSSRAWFFAGCVALVLLWMPSYFLVKDVDTYQLLINTPTTVITFLLVGLAQNTARRADDALQQKLNAVAAFLASDHSEHARAELRAAVGLEDRESSD